MEQVFNISVVISCLFVLIMTLIAAWDSKNGTTMAVIKEQIRHAQRDTLGRKIYKWLIIVFCTVGVCFGLSPATYFFLFMAVLSERMIVYRICRGDRDVVGRFLKKIDW